MKRNLRNNYIYYKKKPQGFFLVSFFVYLKSNYIFIFINIWYNKYIIELDKAVLQINNQNTGETYVYCFNNIDIDVCILKHEKKKFRKAGRTV